MTRRITEHRTCSKCGSHTTQMVKKIRKNGAIAYESTWIRNGEGGWWCKYCYNKIKDFAHRPNNLASLKARNDRKNKLRIAFLGKRVMLTFDPRKHACVNCGKKGEKLLTHLHHYFYVPIMPWACTNELCTNCHGDKGYELGQMKVGKYSISFFGSGRHNPQWKGGTAGRNYWRRGGQYKRWRNAVWIRDDYTCQHCHRKRGRGVIVEAHHIKKAEIHLELMYDVGNGITLCRECHYETRKKKKIEIEEG